MRSLLLSLLIAFTAVSASANSYSTNFTNENPSMWLHGGTNGGRWANVQFSPNFAYGSQTGNQNYDDSIAVLTGSWGQNQMAQITAKIAGKLGAQFSEIEVHINTTIGSGSITGYEVNCSVDASNPYIQIVKWKGAFGSFQELDGRGVGCKNGDVLKAVRNGSTITAYKNGSAILSVNDSTYLGGSPGIGFYIQTVLSGSTAGPADAAFGASTFCATDSGTTCNSGNSAPSPASVSLSWHMPSGGMAVILRASVGSSSQCTTVANWTTLAATASSTYSDSNVSIGSSYCYTILFTSGDLYSQASGIVGVDVTATSGAGVVFSAPPPLSPATNFNGSVLN